MNLQERFLYHIWDEEHLNPELYSVSGKEIRILYQGRFNTNRGPDFVNASIQVDDDILSGSIEIHLNHLDWNRHNHHEDPYYNNVVLHVVFEHNSPCMQTIKEDGGACEILELKSFLTEDITKLISNNQFKSPIHSTGYCDKLSLITEDRLSMVLKYYGTKRFEAKIKRFNAMLVYNDFDQILYQGLMEVIGYDKNKYNMLLLSQEIPWRSVSNWFCDGMTSNELSAILCSGSGLLHKSTKIISEEQSRSLMQVYERQVFYSGQINIDWQLFRIRPNNHPLYRIINLSHVLYSMCKQGILGAIIECCQDLSYACFREYILKAQTRDSDFWHGIPKLGNNIIENMYLNILLPVYYLYYSKTGRDNQRNMIKSYYNSFPALPDNYIIRFMSDKIMKKPKMKAQAQQGLIELYYHFCQYHLCEECQRDKLDD